MDDSKDDSKGQLQQLGFQWKGVSKKRPKITVDKSSTFRGQNKSYRDHDSDDSVDDEYGIDGVLKKRKQHQLVIPLIQPKHQEEDIPQNKVDTTIPLSATNTTKSSTHLTIDDRAAQEFLNDIKTSKSDSFHSNSSTLVIPQINNNNDSNNDNNNDDSIIPNGTSSDLIKKKYQPILQASLAPKLKGIVDENERFKIDVSLRPEDVNFKSNIYKQVPIEEYGAAMLRGMGWSGPNKEDEESTKKLMEPLFARDIHLGLGAKAKPIQLNDKSKQQHNTIKIEKSKSEWLLKAEAKLATQKLNVGDIVWLRVAEYAGLRGSVVATRGVPGLNKISVSLEGSGREVYVKRTDAVVLSQEELIIKPYTPADQLEEITSTAAAGATAVITSTTTTTTRGTVTAGAVTTAPVASAEVTTTAAVNSSSSSSSSVAGIKVKAEPGLKALNSSNNSNVNGSNSSSSSSSSSDGSNNKSGSSSGSNSGSSSSSSSSSGNISSSSSSSSGNSSSSSSSSSNSSGDSLVYREEGIRVKHEYTTAATATTASVFQENPHHHYHHKVESKAIAAVATDSSSAAVAKKNSSYLDKYASIGSSSNNNINSSIGISGSSSSSTSTRNNNSSGSSSSYLDKYASIGSSSSSNNNSSNPNKSKPSSLSSSSKYQNEHIHHDKSKSSSSSSSIEKCWLQTGLYIKLISQKFSSKLYLKKGVILDVYGEKLASIRFDHNHEILDNVKQKYIETVVPKKNEHCIVLSGKYRGLEAIVIERRVGGSSGSGSSSGGGGNSSSSGGCDDDDTVMVQLVDEMNIVIELSMDDVCAFQSNLYHQ